MLIRVRTVGGALSGSMRSMHAPALLRWYLFLGATLISVYVFSSGETLRNGVYLAAIALMIPAIMMGRLLHRPSMSICVTMAMAATCFLVAEILAQTTQGVVGTLAAFTDAAPRIAGQLCFIACLVVIANARHGRHLRGLIGDALIVAIGAWLVSWVTMINPGLENSTDHAHTTLGRGLSQPLGVVIIFLLVMLLFADTFRTPAVWFVAAASTAMIAGDIGYAAMTAGHLDGGARTFDTLHMTSFLLAGALFLHPTVRSVDALVPAGRTRGPAGRIWLTSLSMLIPAIVLAAVSTRSPSDRVTRLVSALLMIGAVSGRIYEALRSSAAAHENLRNSAQHDTLTGLPNRQLVVERITAALSDSWSNHTRPAVLFIDIDRFKIINDSLGHVVGDEILRIIARRLHATLPEGVTLGRSSGDEFIALDPDVRTSDEALPLADRVLTAFHEPFHLPSTGDMYVSASVGVAVAEAGGRTTAQELLRNAATAMHQAKDVGRNSLSVFDESMYQQVTQRLHRESGLHRALERREITLAYQPIVDLSCGELVGFEALMRWRLPDGTMVPPTEFIPIAEETGLILALGAWALLEALTQLRMWIDARVCSPLTSMSVNVSPRQLRDPSFISVVNEALRRSNVPADRLWLEVTESVMIIDPDQASAMFHRLRATGAHLSIDDFGTGYSSLSLLRRFPLQRIKIDQSFVANVADDDNARSLVRTILAMAESLGLDAVAEGVENIHQFHALRALGCRRAQGYLFSRPVPPEAVIPSMPGVPYGGHHPSRPAAALWP